MAARRHMIEFGTTIEQLAEIAVSARHNASLNPDAFTASPSRSTTSRAVPFSLILYQAALLHTGPTAVAP